MISNAKENPRGQVFYRRKFYFTDIYNMLVDAFGFTRERAKRALDVYSRDIHDYYNHSIPASKTALVISRYYKG